MAARQLVRRKSLAKMLHDVKESSRMYRAITRQIEVTVEPNFMPERSSVENRQYFWAYTIVITNTGAETVQLRTRHWVITDATGRKQEVRGEGVVGEQPVLAPASASNTPRVYLCRPPPASWPAATRWSPKAANASRSTCRRSRWTARKASGC